MGKKFFDVFPTLKLDTGLKDLYEQVTVEKVSSTKRKDFLRVYISSDRLIFLVSSLAMSLLSCGALKRLQSFSASGLPLL